MCYDRESEVRKVQDCEVRDVGLGFNLLSCAHSCSLEEYPTISDKRSYYKYSKYGEVVTRQRYIGRDKVKIKYTVKVTAYLPYGRVRDTEKYGVD